MSKNISVPPVERFKGELVGGEVTPVRVVLRLSRLGDYSGDDYQRFLPEKELGTLMKAIDAFNKKIILRCAGVSQKVQEARGVKKIADDLIGRCRGEAPAPVGETPPWPDSLGLI